MGNLIQLRKLIDDAEANAGTPHQLVRVKNPAWEYDKENQPRWFEVSDFSQVVMRDSGEEAWITFLTLTPCPVEGWKPSSDTE